MSELTDLIMDFDTPVAQPLPLLLPKADYFLATIS
jgi:hypothetical protein